MIKKLLSCLGPYKKYAILAPIIVIGEVVLEVLIPYIMAKIVDVGIAGGDLSYITRMGIAMILMAVVSLLCGALAARFAAVASTGLAKGVREKLFNKIQDFSFANVDKFSTPSLVTRLTTDVTNTQNAFMMSIRMMVRAPIMLICAVFLAVTISPRLSLIYLVAMPILVCALAIVATKAFPRFRAMLKKYDLLNSSVQENLIGIRAVKAFVREDHESEKFRAASEDLRQAQIKAEKLFIVIMPVMQFVMYGCMISIAWFGGNMIIAGGMLTGELMSFISYSSQILMSLMMISMVFINLVLSRASVSRIVEVFDEVPGIREPQSPVTEVPSGAVEFKDVSFSYGKTAGKPVLEGVNLSIGAGETIGIIGGTGSAKSTLVQLIPRLYDTSGGTVSVGGRDVRDYSIASLRNSVAMVLQKNVLFSGTIRENLKWGNPQADDQEIFAACKTTMAHDFIQSFPNGYDTELGQGGVNLSGGQKQRLCIARALLKKPKIIILDDSTSAVDTATDSSIRAALRTGLAGMTTIIISQRVISVKDADRIVVMDDGRIDGIGTHQELLESNEIYREVYETQQKGDEVHAGA